MEISERIRHRKIHPNLKEIQTFKKTLYKKRLDLARQIKSEPWSMKHLEDAVNELFKGEAAESDLKMSILHIMNKTKDS